MPDLGNLLGVLGVGGGSSSSGGGTSIMFIIIGVLVVATAIAISIFVLTQFKRFKNDLVIYTLMASTPKISKKLAAKIKSLKEDLTLEDVSQFGNMRVYFDRGADLTLKDGSRKFRLLWDRRDIPPMDYKYFMPGRKGRSVIHLFRVSEDIYIPLAISDIDVDRKGLKMIAEDTDVQFWNILIKDKIRRAFLKESFFTKYGMQITFVVLAALSIVLIYMLIQHAENVIPALEKIALSLGKCGANTGVL